MVDKLSVEIRDSFDTRQLFQLLDATDADSLFTVVRHPHRDGIAPVPVSGEAPVFGIDEPVVESFLLNEGRNPSSFGILFKKIFLDVSHFNEPTVKTPVDERGLGTPAEGVTMLNRATGHQSTCSLNVGGDHFVSFLDVLTFIVGNLFNKLTVLVNWNGRFSWVDKPILNASIVIFFTKTRSLVDDTCS